MVDLAIPQPPVTVSKAPTTSITSADIRGPYSELAASLDKFGDAAENVAESLATQAGLKAVTRDADGNIQVEKAPIIGPASKYYAHAVKMAALTEGEADARRADISLRQKFHDKPDEYLAAANARTKELQDQYEKAAGPEVALALRRSVEPIVTQTFKSLLNEKERLDLHRAVNSIDSEVEVAKNDLYSMARNGITSGPDWDRANDKITTLYNSKVANPRLAFPPEMANAELSHFKSELRVQGLAHHVVDDIYARDGYEAAAKVAESIRTDRGLNLTPQQRDTSYSRVMTELNARARDDLRVQKSVAGDIQAVAKNAIDGYPVPPEQMGQLRASVVNAKVPELGAALDQTQAIVGTMKQWRAMTPAQLEGSLSALDKTMRESGATDPGRAMLDAGGKLLKTMRTEVGKDPLGWAARSGVMDVPPIPFGTADAPSAMTDRATRAEMIAQHYGIAPTYLRPDEKSALEATASKGGDIMIGLARTLVDGFGERAPKVMAEISTEAPVLAHIGALAQSGGNPAFATDVADAVKLRQDKDFKTPKWLDHPADKIMSAQGGRARDVLGDAYALAPDTGRAAQKAAQDAFFTRAVRSGYEPLLDTSESKKAYDRALQEASGARFVGGVQYGGVGDYKPGYWTGYKVLVPSNVRSDRFKDVIGAITDDDLSKLATSPMTADGRAYTPADLRAAVPVATRNGYRFAVGDVNSEDPKYIRGADGKPFVLDFGQMEERLRARVPGAFLGAK